MDIPWDFIDKFNAITGFFLFFITLANLWFSWRINKKINSAVDLNRLKESKDTVIGKIDAIIRILEIEQSVSDESKTNIVLLITQLRATYPDIKQLNSGKLLKKVQSNGVNFIHIRELLTRLITEIERIV